MTAKLHQIAFTYDVHEDRLLMRIKMSDMSEVRAWLTRRFTMGFWNVLMQALDNAVAVEPIVQQTEKQPTPMAKETKQAMIGFKHSEKVQQADFKQEFKKEVKATPLGASPILLSQISLTPGPGENQTLGLFPKKGQGIQLAMNDTLLHSIAKLLVDAHNATQWGLNLTVPGTEMVSPIDQKKLN